MICNTLVEIYIPSERYCRDDRLATDDDYDEIQYYHFCIGQQQARTSTSKHAWHRPTTSTNKHKNKQASDVGGPEE